MELFALFFIVKSSKEKLESFWVESAQEFCEVRLVGVFDSYSSAYQVHKQQAEHFVEWYITPCDLNQIILKHERTLDERFRILYANQREDKTSIALSMSRGDELISISWDQLALMCGIFSWE